MSIIESQLHHDATQADLVRLFANHVLRCLVFPNPEKDRLAKAIIARPFENRTWQTITGFTQWARRISAAPVAIFLRRQRTGAEHGSSQINAARHTYNYGFFNLLPD
jgi:hypothetical protein